MYFSDKMVKDIKYAQYTTNDLFSQAILALNEKLLDLSHEKKA
jgi:hypothetical protein